MHCSARLLSAIFCGVNVALVQTVTQAKTKVEIGRIAKSVTLRIESVGTSEKGSGILLQRQGDYIYCADSSPCGEECGSF